MILVVWHAYGMRDQGITDEYLIFPRLSSNVHFFVQIIWFLDESPYVIYTGFCVTTCKKRKTILK